MGFWSNLLSPSPETLAKWAAGDAEREAKNEAHRLFRAQQFPFTSKETVEPGLYWLVSHSRLKARGIHRWRMTKGRGHKSFVIDFQWEILHSQQPAFASQWGDPRAILPHTESLIRLTATHADPNPITRDERKSALPMV